MRRRRKAVGLLCLLALVWLSGSAQARSAPGIDPLTRPEQRAGRIDVGASLSLGSGGRREAAAGPGGYVEALQAQHDATLAMQAEYYLGERTIFAASASGSYWRMDSVLESKSGRAESREESSRTAGSLGLRYRLRPDSLWDPHGSVALTSSGGGRLSIGVSRIADPIVLAGGVSVVAESWLPGARRDLVVAGSVGFVANDRVSLAAGWEMRVPLGRVDLVGTSASLGWNWVVSPDAKSETGLRLGVDVRGGEARTRLEWTWRWSRR